VIHVLFSEIIVDNFAGGGGASTGIEMAIGRSVDIAINHDPAAIAMYKANHPDTEIYCESVWEVDPQKVTFGRPVALCWLSPDCKHFSKAKGGKPVDKQIRGLAWVAVRWAATVKPRVIILENVEEFKTWGPLLENGMPDPKNKGRTFKAFINALKRHGYQVDWRELRACDYGAPTIRKRLFLVARCDGLSIVWPRPTHGDPNTPEVIAGKLKPWRTAAEIIDWSLPCPSIFDRKKPLAENTLKRIARGVQRFVIENPNPFIIKVNHSGEDFRGQSLDEPIQTVTAKNGWGIVSPVIARIGQTGFGGDRMQYPIEKPLTTVTTKAEHLLVAPVIARQFGKSVGHSMDEPLGTITAGGGGKSQLVAAFLAQYHTETARHEVRGQSLDKPLYTLDTSPRYALVTAGGLHVGEVRAFLLKYYGTNIGQACGEPLQTITTKHRFGLVTIHGQDYQIVDIGMRMLEPHELFAAQGFPADYIIDRDYMGNRYPKAAQVARCGNAVPPQFAEHLVRANLPELCVGKVQKRSAAR
jgi:DNA (cytosine-5)-methyltransferase 1